MPQEIDGKGGETPPLCRNRDAPPPLASAQPEDQPVGQLEPNRRCTGHPAPIMNYTIHAPQRGAARAVLALALAGSLSFASAEEFVSIPMPEAELAPVTVSALGGLAVPYDQTGVSVTVLDLPELKKQGIDTLNEALSTVPGVSVQPDGLNQRGNVGNIALRGMNCGQHTLPMMDGMRLYCFSNGANITPNIVGRTDLFSLGRLEVLRGSQGAVYGAGSMGGVLYMETPEGQGEPAYRLFQEAGSFDSYTGNAIAQGRVENLAYFVSSTYERTNNDIRYADGRPVKPRHAGHYSAWNEAMRLDYDVNKDNKLTLTYRREDADYSYLSPDYGGGVTSCRDYSFRSNLVTARLNSRVNESFSTSLMAGYYGVDNKLGDGFNLNLRNVQIEWRNSYTWNQQHATTAGLAWNRSDFRTISSTPGMDDTLDHTYGFFAEHLYRPAKNWDNSLALRWDQSNVWDGQASVRAASNYRFTQTGTRVYASAGNGYKTPSGLQRKGRYDAGYTSYVGNSNIGCEHNLTVDAGVEQQFAEDHAVSATLFWTRVTDGITTVPTADPAVTSYANSNVHWTIQGLELAAHGTWERHWNTGYRVAFTYTQPKMEDDAQLLQTARQVWSADVHTSPFEDFTTGVGLTATVGRSASFAGLRLDNYYTLRWYANYKLNEHLSFHLRVENLTDQRFISEEVWGNMNQNGAILSSGAAIYGGCTLMF